MTVGGPGSRDTRVFSVFLRREDPRPFFSPTPGHGPELRVPIRGRPGIQRPGSCPAHLVPGGEGPGSPPSLPSGLLLSTCLASGMPLPQVLCHTSCLLSPPGSCLTPRSLSRPRSPVSPQVSRLTPGPLSCPRSLSHPMSPVSPQVPYLAPGPCLIPATGLLQSQPIQDGSGLLCCPRDDAVRCTHMLEEGGPPPTPTAWPF